MNLQRAYTDEPDTWYDITMDTFILRTEWAGYYPRGTALQELQKRGTLTTPAYIFRIKEEKEMSKKKAVNIAPEAAVVTTSPEQGSMDTTPLEQKPAAEKKPRGFPLGTIRHYKNGEAFRRIAPPKGWEYIGKTGSERVLAAEATARANGFDVIYFQPTSKEE
jgi:hypothetical protein